MVRQRLNIGGKLRLQLLGVSRDHHLVAIVSVKPVQRCRQKCVALAGPSWGFDQRRRALIQPVTQPCDHEMLRLARLGSLALDRNQQLLQRNTSVSGAQLVRDLDWDWLDERSLSGGLHPLLGLGRLRTQRLLRPCLKRVQDYLRGLGVVEWAAVAIGPVCEGKQQVPSV